MSEDIDPASNAAAGRFTVRNANFVFTGQVAGLVTPTIWGVQMGATGTIDFGSDVCNYGAGAGDVLNLTGQALATFSNLPYI